MRGPAGEGALSVLSQVDEAMLQVRAAVYELARQKNPLRWSNQTRDWRFINKVHLNPENPQTKEPNAERKAA